MGININFHHINTRMCIPMDITALLPIISPRITTTIIIIFTLTIAQNLLEIVRYLLDLKRITKIISITTMAMIRITTRNTVAQINSIRIRISKKTNSKKDRGADKKIVLRIKNKRKKIIRKLIIQKNAIKRKASHINSLTIKVAFYQRKAIQERISN
jgi:hypothetical protein